MKLRTSGQGLCCHTKGRGGGGLNWKNSGVLPPLLFCAHEGGCQGEMGLGGGSIRGPQPLGMVWREILLGMRSFGSWRVSSDPPPPLQLGGPPVAPQLCVVACVFFGSSYPTHSHRGLATPSRTGAEWPRCPASGTPCLRRSPERTSATGHRTLWASGLQVLRLRCLWLCPEAAPPPSEWEGSPRLHLPAQGFRLQLLG